MQDVIFKLKNRMGQPLPLEYAGKSISLPSGGVLECTESEYACAEIQRHVREKRLKLIVIPASVEPERVSSEIEEEEQVVNLGDPIAHKMAPKMVEQAQDTELEEEKDSDSLTSILSEPDNVTEEPVESAKKRSKRSRLGSRLGKKDNKDQE